MIEEGGRCFWGIPFKKCYRFGRQPSIPLLHQTNCNEISNLKQIELIHEKAKIQNQASIISGTRHYQIYFLSFSKSKKAEDKQEFDISERGK